MNTRLSRIFAVIFIIFGLVLFFVPGHIAPVCPMPSVEKPMDTKMQGEKQMEACSSEECKISADNAMSNSKSTDKPMAKPMRCYHTGNAIKGVAVMMGVLGLVFFLIDNKEIRTGLAISNIALGILPIMFIHIIGVCKMAAMRCRTMTTPTVYLLSGLYIVLNIVFLIRNRK